MPNQKLNDVRITVLKRLELPEISGEYSADGHTVCIMTKEGREYLSKGCEKPAGLCGWAWVAMQPKVAFLAMGHDYPWAKVPGTEIFSCSDGLHPVVYKLERIEERAE